MKRLLSAVSLAATLPLGLVAQKQNPNIIIIYIDDMGYSDLGCYGGNFTPTPNIDKLAAEGIRFTQYYSAAPVSSPSRAALTTGMYPIKFGMNTFLNDRKMNRNCEQNDYLDSNAPTMARALKDAGYSTAHIGKWHIGGGRDVDDAPSISSYGFDEYASTWESPDPDPLLTSTDWIWADTDSIKRWDRTAYFVDKTIDFLSRNKGKPCFINLWPDDIHTPWVPSKEVAQMRHNVWDSQEAFIPVLAELDKQIGRLTDRLKEMGLEENTIIIFTSDNGPAPSFNNTRTGNMRGTKNSLYEGGIKEPFIVKWPKKIKPGQTDMTSVICSVDIFPTLCKIANANIPKGLDGIDMSKAFSGKGQQRKSDLFWDFGRNKYFNFPKEYNRSPHLAMRRIDWKLLCNADGSDIQLYDLKNDVNETRNIADQYPVIADGMKKELIEWYNKNNNKRKE